MTIAILETAHFQYAITQSELFPESKKIIFATIDDQAKINQYCDHIQNYEFVTIESIAKNYRQIAAFITDNRIDLLLISPVFEHYVQLNKLLKLVRCTVVLTTHNINTWFHGRFWSPRSLQDKIVMRSIANKCDYIAVEDFIYNHLTSTQDKLTKRYKFIYIPFTIFHPGRETKYTKPDDKLRVVLTGHLDGARRRYEMALATIDHFKDRSDRIHFSFAGRAKDEHGRAVVSKLDEMNASYPNYVNYFNDQSTAEMFRYEMEVSDLVLSMSNLTFKGMGTLEYIGKTKPTAAIHDMMTYELPGLLPQHLLVPENLVGSVFNYTDTAEIIAFIEELLAEPEKLNKLKAKAAENSLNFTPDKIRQQLPF